MKSFDEVKSLLKTQELKLKNEFNVSKIGVFGSFARRENTDKSDVDILVEFEQPIGMFKFIHLENYLSNLIGENVDLVSRNALKSVIKDEVLGQTIYV